MYDEKSIQMGEQCVTTRLKRVDEPSKDQGTSVEGSDERCGRYKMREKK